MKHLILILTAILLFASCSNTSSKTPSQTIPQQPKNIESLMKKIFIEKYPNFNENQLAKKEALNEIISILDDSIVHDYFEDIPLSLVYVGEEKDGTAFIDFTKYQCFDKSIICRLKYTIVAFSKKETALTLSKNNKYLISGKSYLRRKQSTPRIENWNSDSYIINLGTYRVVLDSVKVVEGT